LLGLYIASLVFGGGLLALTLFGGHGGHEVHMGGDAGHDVHAGHDGHSHDSRGSQAFSVVLSLRFWTFLLAFGGLTGLLLTLIGAPDGLCAILAGSAGAVLGGVAAFSMQKLDRDQVSGTLSEDDWLGKTGRVMLPVSSARNGKIRMEFDGEVQDLLATVSEEDGELGVGDAVIVVSLADGVAKVAKVQKGG
jgi:hypothetical protein